MLESLLSLWNIYLIDPMVNLTIVLAHVLFNSYGLAIIVFTLIIRGLTLPLMIRQVHSQRRMTLLQPQLSDIQKRVKDPKKRSAETMKLYKEAGVNPVGCLGPMLIQFPIWIALYDVIRTVLGSTPESLIDLSSRLYPWSFIQQAIPLGNHFLLWDMGSKDSTYVLPVLVAASMFVQQKLTMTQASMSAANQSSAQTNQTMLWMMPLMFGYFTLSVPTGLALYWMVTNVIGVIMNYYIFGWRGTSLKDIFFKPATAAVTRGRRPRPSNGARPNRQEKAQALPDTFLPVQDDSIASGIDRSRTEKRDANGREGRGGGKRKNGRRGDRSGTPTTRSGSQSGSSTDP